MVRKHAHTQRRLCERFAGPVIGAVICQDITTGHMQQIVSASPTAGEGDRVRGMISALVTAGLEGGYLASLRLAKVHRQAGDRPMPPPRATVAGESGLWVDPAEVPADADVAGLGHALAAGRHGDRGELMAVTAAYSGLRWGELAALTIAQVDPAARVIAVDRKVVEVAGHLYVQAPKNRKYRRTIYPRCTPAGTRWPSGSPPVLNKSAPGRPPAPTRWGWSSLRKLVRDRIPEIIRADGRYPVTYVLDEAGDRHALLDKLAEEAAEATRAAAADLPGELADVLEVLPRPDSRDRHFLGPDPHAADDKRHHRGGFEDKVFLEAIE